MKAPELKTIAPGVSMFSVKTSRFKTCNISVAAAVPFDSDISENFSAAALLPYLLRRSCAKYRNFTQLNRKLDELYGARLSASIAKQGDARIITMHISAIDDRFSLSSESISENAAKLLFDLLFEPNFEDGKFVESEVEGEKRLLIERLENEKSEKRIYAFNRCTEIMFEGETYAKNKYGTVEEIESLDAECMTKAWKKLLQTAKIRISVISSGDSTEIENTLKEKFAEIDRKAITLSAKIVPQAAAVKEITEEQPVKQGKLVMGFRAGVKDINDNNPAVSVMADLFGGGTYSRLFMNVREKMSLCYYCSARLNKYKGFIAVQSGIETENAEKAKNAILQQLDDIRNGGITQEELEFSKRSFYDSLAGYFDTPEMLDAWYSTQIFWDKLKSTDERMEEIKGVTLEDITEAAKKVTLDTVYMLKSNSEGGEEDED